MLRREWTAPAAKRFEHAQDHYHALNPVAAAAMARQVLEATRRLGEQPGLGRPGRVAGTREWRVARTPYLLVYRVRDDALQVLHVEVDARDWMPRTEPWIEPLEPWLAALASALLHVLMVFALLHASTPTMSTPQGAVAGGRMKVDFLGETSEPEQPAPPSPPPPSATSPVRSTVVKDAKDPLPPDVAATPRRVPAPRPIVQRPSQSPSPTPAPVQRRPETWTGRPPGMLDEDVAEDDGLADSAAFEPGYRNDRRSAEPSLDVGGYQVYYDLRSETQLRAWKEQGMKEIAILLPGTQNRMVCPLEIALRRGSGKCRLLPPDSPELQSIGDAREVINMMEVYRRGEPVWRGPGPYR